MKRIISISLLWAVTAGCGGGHSRTADTAVSAAAPAGSPVDTASQKKTISDVGFSSPETALWDSVADVYLLSNINGKPADEDNNGFVARIRPDGTMDKLKWIEGGRNGVTLHGPKGMVFKGDTLFVADVGGVREFDRATGKPLGSLRVATRGLNDLAVADDGSLYATDLEPPPNGAVSAPPAAIYRVTAQGGMPVVTGSELEQPDGLIADKGAFVVAPFGTNEVYRIDSAGKKSVVAVLPGKRLDGLYRLPNASWAVTSWDTKTVYRIDPNGAAIPIAEGIESPAQLGIDAKRHLLLIPSFNGNALEIRPFTM